MASRQKVFLIKADNGKECVIRLPVKQYDAITSKGFEMVRNRFYDGSTRTHHGLKYALPLEHYSNADDLIKALQNYQKNII